MDMVDSALERPDVALSKHGTIGLNRVPLRALRSCFLTQNRVAGPVSFNSECKTHLLVQENSNLEKKIGARALPRALRGSSNRSKLHF